MFVQLRDVAMQVMCCALIACMLKRIEHIRKMIENMMQKSVGNNMNEHEISNVCFVCRLP